MIDNTSNFRMDRENSTSCPRVQPTRYPNNVEKQRHNCQSNCSTIQMVQVLKPLDSAFGIERVDVSTYQATSGAGKEGMEELVHQTKEFFCI